MEFIGIFLPLLIEVVNKDVKTDYQRFLMAVVTCIIASVVIHPEYFTHLTFTNFPQFFSTAEQSFILIYAESSLVFKIYWSNSFTRYKVQALLGSSAIQK